MRSKFRGHVPHTEKDFEALWADAVFSFDTAVLLNAYRLSKPAADAFLAALNWARGRVWLPYQVGAEFFRHRPAEIHGQLAEYTKAADHLKELSGVFRKVFPRHHLIPIDEIAAALDKLAADWAARLDELKGKHHDSTDADPTLRLYLDVFDGCVGGKPDEAQLKEWHKEAEARYAKKIPPGFEDAKKKDGGREYGDAVLWFQLIEHTKATKKPVIFVTDDAKEDWWLRLHGRTIGPRPELGQEMHEKTGVLFHAYSMSRFVEEVGKKRGAAADQGVIEDIRNVEKTPAHPSALDLAMRGFELGSAMELAARGLTRPAFPFGVISPEVLARVPRIPTLAEIYAQASKEALKAAQSAIAAEEAAAVQVWEALAESGGTAGVGEHAPSQPAEVPPPTAPSRQDGAG